MADHKTRYEDITGFRFGLLTVIGFKRLKPCNSRFWKCKCQCGNVTHRRRWELKRPKVPSCGCYKKTGKPSTRHGMSRTNIYRRWADMMDRCRNANSDCFKNYGGRGIFVCEEWHDFTNFHRDMGCPSGRVELDRIDNNAGYCKENCRWVSRKINSRNRRTNRIINFNGESLTMAEWCERLGINHGTMHARIRCGWTIEEALTTPVQKHKQPIK